jgi:hypothetical protein
MYRYKELPEVEQIKGDTLGRLVGFVTITPA